jgi:hypothetical protein
MPRHVDALIRLFPVLGRVPFPVAPRSAQSGDVEPHVVRRRAEVALRELLSRLADRTTLILWVDDAQWGDLDGAALLRAVLRPPDPPGLLLLLSYRSEDRHSSPLLQAIEAEGRDAGDPREPELALPPLSRAEAEEMARGLLRLVGRTDDDEVS